MKLRQLTKLYKELEHVLQYDNTEKEIELTEQLEYEQEQLQSLREKYNKLETTNKHLIDQLDTIRNLIPTFGCSNPLDTVKAIRNILAVDPTKTTHIPSASTRDILRIQKIFPSITDLRLIEKASDYYNVSLNTLAIWAEQNCLKYEYDTLIKIKPSNISKEKWNELVEKLYTPKPINTNPPPPENQDIF